MKFLFQKEFQWRGCSDDIMFGIEVVRSFIDDSIRPKSLRQMMQLHNSVVSQKVIYSTAV